MGRMECYPKLRQRGVVTIPKSETVLTWKKATN